MCIKVYLLSESSTICRAIISASLAFCSINTFSSSVCQKYSIYHHLYFSENIWCEKIYIKRVQANVLLIQMSRIKITNAFRLNLDLYHFSEMYGLWWRLMNLCCHLFNWVCTYYCQTLQSKKLTFLQSNCFAKTKQNT